MGPAFSPASSNCLQNISKIILINATKATRNDPKAKVPK